MAPKPIKGAIPDALKHFDSLPDAAGVRQPVVEGLFGCSSSTVWRMVKAGQLPKPKKQSERVTTWNVGELRQALAKVSCSRITTRSPRPRETDRAEPLDSMLPGA